MANGRIKDNWRVPPIKGGPFIELCAENARRTHLHHSLSRSYGLGKDQRRRVHRGVHHGRPLPIPTTFFGTKPNGKRTEH